MGRYADSVPHVRCTTGRVSHEWGIPHVGCTGGCTVGMAVQRCKGHGALALFLLIPFFPQKCPPLLLLGVPGGRSAVEELAECSASGRRAYRGSS